MAAGLKDLKQRITGVGQVQKATSAMQKVAASRVAGYRKAIASVQAYTSQLTWLLDTLCQSRPWPDHPFFNARPVRTINLLVFGSDRGLCGGFNSRLIDCLYDYITEHPGCVVRLTVMGKVVARRALRHGWTIEQLHPQPVRPVDGGGRRDARFWEAPVQALTQTAVNAYLRGDYDQVDVLYSHFVSGLDQTPTVARLLPLRRDPVRQDLRRRLLDEAGFEPDPVTLIERLVPEHLRWVVANAFLNSIGSENAARQMAMARATENAGEMLAELKLTFSRLRQESITGEMIELSRGAEPAGATTRSGH